MWGGTGGLVGQTPVARGDACGNLGVLWAGMSCERGEGRWVGGNAICSCGS